MNGRGKGPKRPFGRGSAGPDAPFPLRLPSVRGFLLFALPLPLLFASIIALGAGKFGNMLADASAFALFMLGAVLTRRGMQEAAGSAERRYGKRPWITLKNLGAACVTAATATAAFFGVGHGLANSLAFGGVSLLAFHLVYGLDPIRRAELRIPGISQKDQVTETLAEAEERLLSIETSARRLRNPELRGRLGRIAGQGREILALIERRPRDLRRARKFLTVYLEGAESVSQGYAAAHQVVDTGDLEQNFRNVLVTIEDVFAEQQKRLLETDLMDLDVQIEVLNKQLKREGIR